ncbi:MAG TPA: UDP-3-O-acyl-N-acetylglucosamine deacetylase [Xanthomonadaceae bacterium]|nr:UDP-3-O-acyl-N-acetylglucosamine deacetylase [Xanthomonadaceae bacterium]
MTAVPPPRPLRQRTLAVAVAIDGIGIHSGRAVRLGLHPAAADAGVVFVRTDLPEGAGIVRATWDRVVNSRLHTLLGNATGATVSAVEHLMAALAASGIDNLRIVLDGPEVPILDGSAAGWMALIEATGTRPLSAPRQVIRVRRPVHVLAGEAWATVLPANDRRYSVSIDFAHPAIGRQRYDFRLDGAAFRRDIAPARTFGFLRDAAKLQAQGLALGGSADNAVVIGEAGVLNLDGLRFPDEFVRHKLLDLIGDLHLAGAPILGHVIAHRPGHALNHALLHALMTAKDAWTLAPAGESAPEATDENGRLPAVPLAGLDRLRTFPHADGPG